MTIETGIFQTGYFMDEARLSMPIFLYYSEVDLDAQTQENLRDGNIDWGENARFVPLMRECIALAEKNKSEGKTPVACVFVGPKLTKGKHSGKYPAFATVDRNPFWNPPLRIILYPHAEIDIMNAIAWRDNKFPPVSEWTCITNLEPCAGCTTHLFENGVHRFIYSVPSGMGGFTQSLDKPRFLQSAEMTRGKLYNEATGTSNVVTVGGMCYEAGRAVVSNIPNWDNMLGNNNDGTFWTDEWYRRCVVAPAGQGMDLSNNYRYWGHGIPQPEYYI